MVNARTNPRFDMRDKDGIIFDPIAPRAGERLIAKCTLVGLTDTDKRSVRIKMKNSEKQKSVFYFRSVGNYIV